MIDIFNRFNHPNIVRLYDAVKIDKNSICTILEYCDGPELS
jgi:tousled-like kinase